jgi:hypothetical protein
MCPHTPEDYSPAEEVRKLRAKQKEEARGRREQEEEAFERHEDEGQEKPLTETPMSP